MPNIRLIPCPICHTEPWIYEDVQDMYIVCSEDCLAPKCAHHNPKDTAMSWNDWARWYLQQGSSVKWAGPDKEEG